MQMSSPPRMSVVDVVGRVTAVASAPNLNGAIATIRMKGAESAKNSHSEVVETTRTPAIFSKAQTITTAKATITPRCPSANQGNKRSR
jgi:hypothetical protein